jgi:hypothetical protein
MLSLDRELNTDPLSLVYWYLSRLAHPQLYRRYVVLPRHQASKQSEHNIRVLELGNLDFTHRHLGSECWYLSVVRAAKQQALRTLLTLPQLVEESRIKMASSRIFGDGLAAMQRMSCRLS